jgi:hypothetical protein
MARWRHFNVLAMVKYAININVPSYSGALFSPSPTALARISTARSSTGSSSHGRRWTSRTVVTPGPVARSVKTRVGAAPKVSPGGAAAALDSRESQSAASPGMWHAHRYLPPRPGRLLHLGGTGQDVTYCAVRLPPRRAGRVVAVAPASSARIPACRLPRARRSPIPGRSSF